MLGYYLHNLDPFIFRISGNIGPRWYGMAYVLAFVFAYLLLRVLSKRGYLDLPVSALSDFVTWVAFFGVMVGGRIGYVLFYKPEMLRDPLSILRVWEGGMSSHGGIIGVVVFTLIYSRRHKLPWTNPGDNLCVVAPIGLFLGRCANFINGELYGRVTTVPWAMQFPKELLDPANAAQANSTLANCQYIDPSIRSIESMIDAVRTNPKIADILRGVLTPRHPSQLYEAALEGVVLFSILWFVRTRFRTPNGFITGLFLIVYSVLRIIVENFREPDAPLVGMFTRGQFFSLFTVVIGIGFIVVSRRNPSYPRALKKNPRKK
ncbi:MAG TPA: prolipoprotein diacylglyceryl transferase [Chthoniobacterales bacterium]|jgi:phosphatidylglycerol:prolipoprotein diacylglycerol transferase|nr:prolipoprotein diacylglyceryl transferase [Chthoniobacterales bacterium]